MSLPDRHTGHCHCWLPPAAAGLMVALVEPTCTQLWISIKLEQTCLVKRIQKFQDIQKSFLNHLETKQTNKTYSTESTNQIYQTKPVKQTNKQNVQN